MRTKRKNRARLAAEWKRGIIANPGIISPWPIEILFNFISEKNLFEIINKIWDKNIKQIYLLEICTIMQYWWIDPNINAARFAFVDNKSHHSSEIVFDKFNERSILNFRQPDIDGKHWNSSHIHIMHGLINQDDKFKLINVNFDQHVELLGPPIDGKYIIKIY